MRANRIVPHGTLRVSFRQFYYQNFWPHMDYIRKEKYALPR